MEIYCSYSVTLSSQKNNKQINKSAVLVSEDAYQVRI